MQPTFDQLTPAERIEYLDAYDAERDLANREYLAAFSAGRSMAEREGVFANFVALKHYVAGFEWARQPDLVAITARHAAEAAELFGDAETALEVAA